ncbi:MAG: hypothetical protein DRI52_02780, partial [Chloroflexi bacterium]
QQGTVRATRESVLNFLSARFDFPYAVGRAIEERLETIDDEAALRELVTAAARAENVAQFRDRLDEISAELHSKPTRQA